MPLCFMTKKIYTVSKFRTKLAAAKAAEPYAIGFWKRKLNLDVGKKHVVVEFQMYLGHKTPSIAVEVTAQYRPD